jgi:hypothetical protein
MTMVSGCPPPRIQILGAGFLDPVRSGIVGTRLIPVPTDPPMRVVQELASLGPRHSPADVACADRYTRSKRPIRITGVAEHHEAYIYPNENLRHLHLPIRVAYPEEHTPAYGHCLAG